MTDRRFYKRHPALSLLTVIAVSVILIMTGLEILIWTFLQFPKLNNHFPYLKDTVVDIYYNEIRDIVQFKPECAQYDKELFYTLRPGSCTHKAREFEYEYFINSAGLRDDESSLINPKIVMLGDSYGMGWGVEQEKTYAQLVEKSTGLNTLNASISSYGTAREFTLLDRVDLSDLKLLIIQYCNNDFAENKVYVDSNYVLPIQSESVYQTIVDLHKNLYRYEPFFYLTTLIEVEIRPRISSLFQKIIKSTSALEKSNPKKNIVSLASKDKREEFRNALAKYPPYQKIKPASSDEEATYFLDILSKRQELSNVQIIFFPLYNSIQNSIPFMESLENLIDENDYPDFIKTMTILRLENILNDEDFFILDAHINEQGHQKVAEEIVRLIKGSR